MKRFLIPLLATFAVIFVTDMVIHGMILKPDYEASKALWRSEAAMQQCMGSMMLGQFMLALGMVLFWLRGSVEKANWQSAFTFGLTAGLLGLAYIPIFYAVQPLPSTLCVKWVVFGLSQTLVTSVVLFLVTRSKKA